MSPFCFSTRIGKLYQIQHLGCIPHLENDSDESVVFLQSALPLFPKSTSCCTRTCLKSALLNAYDKKIVLFTISTFVVDDELLSWLYISTTQRNDIYILAIENIRLFFIDEFITSILI